MSSGDAKFYEARCLKTKVQCNPAQVTFCLCWWESESLEDFDRLFRERYASVAQR